VVKLKLWPDLVRIVHRSTELFVDKVDDLLDRPDGREIEKVLEVPWSALTDPRNFRIEWWERAGGQRPVYFYDWQGETIWGATARILKHYIEVVTGEWKGR